MTLNITPGLETPSEIIYNHSASTINAPIAAAFSGFNASSIIYMTANDNPEDTITMGKQIIVRVTATFAKRLPDLLLPCIESPKNIQPVIIAITAVMSNNVK